MRIPSTLAALGVILAGATGPLLAQTRAEIEGRFFQQQRLLDEQIRAQREELAPLESRIDWQFGGWLEYYAFHYNDGVQSSRFVQRPALWVWTRVGLDDGAHELFARVKLRYTWFSPGDEIDRQEDWLGPNFDQAWYQIDFGKAFRLTKPSDPIQVRARLGRQPVLFGTGYALDLPLDAALIEAKLGDVQATALFGRSIPSYPNIDRSEPVDSHMNRTFYGVQLAYCGWEKHTPFVYALWNRDHTDERPWTLLQEYDYDSFYFGAGARGTIVHNLNYWAEGVFESGRSYGELDFNRRDVVEAYAWDMGLEYLFDVPTRPRVAAEYMFASGDSGRLYDPTSANGGNRFDRRDTSFVAFGFRDTGLSLAPTMSNLQVWRLGASLAPLERFELFRDLELGANWFLYHKHHRRGAISDPTADNFEGHVGWEMDYFLNWRLTSDISWTVRWGTFFPGSAYSDRGTRHFIFTGLTWSF